MPYIGKSPSAGVRQRYQYTATAGQTTFSGTDLGNLTLTYTDNNFVDVFQNGVLLKGGGTDYTATSGTSVILATGASVSDVIEIIVYDVFSVGNFFNRTDSDSRYVNVSGGTMTGSLDLNGTELVLDADGDTSITADTDDQIDIKIAGSDSVTIKASEIETNGAPFTISNTSNGNNIDIKTTSSGSLVHALKIHSGGRVEPKQGLLIGGDAAANLLDDFEEGTFTPTIIDGAGASQATSSASGVYTKVGDMVHAYVNVNKATASGTDGNMSVGGLPFAVVGGSPSVYVHGNWWSDEGGPSAGDEVCHAYIAAGTSAVFGVKSTTDAQQANTRYVQYSDISNGRPVYLGLSYRTS